MTTPKQHQSNIPLNTSLLDTARGGVWIVSLSDGTTIYVNPSMARMLRYSPAEMIGRSGYDFVFPEDHKISRSQFQKRKQGESATRKHRLRRKDGSEVWVISSTNPIRDDAGEMVAALGFFSEIEGLTLSAGAETQTQAVSQSESRFRGAQLENLVLDPKTLEARVSGKSLELTAFGFKLLSYLVQNAGRVLSRREILQNVWGDPGLPDRVIDAHVVSLRKKLTGFNGEIKTIYGYGYILKWNEP